MKKKINNLNNLKENRFLYSCGYNNQNQTGHFNGKRNLNTPKQVDFFNANSIKEVFSGYHHTFIKTISN
jgi:alpha-tubulin suppressor-like RCC1 family protein